MKRVPRAVRRGRTSSVQPGHHGWLAVIAECGKPVPEHDSQAYARHRVGRR